MWKVEKTLCAGFSFYIFSGKGDTVVSILIDLNDFWTYENREYLVPESTEEVEI